MKGRVEQIAEERWGSGFERAVGMMKVFRLRSGEIVAHHKDTRAGADRATRVASLEELSGWFGFCPRAVSLYGKLGIPVRQVA